jgi:hypothetical protein
VPGLVAVGVAQERTTGWKGAKRARESGVRITLQSDHPFRSKAISRFGVSDHRQVRSRQR